MKQQEIIVLSAPSGSGKSTLVQELRNKITNVRIVSRDPLRNMFFGHTDKTIHNYYKGDISKTEKEINVIFDRLMDSAVKSGKSIIVDNTNLKASYINKWKKYKLPIRVLMLDVDAKTCIQRDQNRARTVGKDVIAKQFQQYRVLPKALRDGDYKTGRYMGFQSFSWWPEELANYTKDYSKGLKDPRLDYSKRYNVKQPNDTPWCVICDLDGTLALMDGRSPYNGEDCNTDRVNNSVDACLALYREAGYKIFLFSGRNSDNGGLEATERWLDINCTEYDVLAMRKPGDQRKDTIVKQEMFDEHINGKFKVGMVLDDRDMMIEHWRSIGVDCWQVYYGDF